MTINFDYRCGILEAADTKTGREWCWYKGDPEVTRTENGELLSSIGVPIGATVVEVKTLIRMDTKKQPKTGCTIYSQCAYDNSYSHQIRSVACS